MRKPIRKDDESGANAGSFKKPTERTIPKLAEVTCCEEKNTSENSEKKSFIKSGKKDFK